jgi:hypothetical protein
MGLALLGAVAETCVQHFAKRCRIASLLEVVELLVNGVNRRAEGVLVRSNLARHRFEAPQRLGRHTGFALEVAKLDCAGGKLFDGRGNAANRRHSAKRGQTEARNSLVEPARYAFVVCSTDCRNTPRQIRPAVSVIGGNALSPPGSGLPRPL